MSCQVPPRATSSTDNGSSPRSRSKPHCHCAGVLFQWPGFLIAALAGAGVANFLKEPAPWLRGIIAGMSTSHVKT